MFESWVTDPETGEQVGIGPHETASVALYRAQVERERGVSPATSAPPQHSKNPRVSLLEIVASPVGLISALVLAAFLALIAGIAARAHWLTGFGLYGFLLAAVFGGMLWLRFITSGNPSAGSSRPRSRRGRRR